MQSTPLLEKYLQLENIQAWKSMNSFMNAPFWWESWEALSPFFSSKGYTLYNYDKNEPSLCPWMNEPPTSSDSFGLYGQTESMGRSNFDPLTTVFAARDAQNRDVVIKLVTKGNDGQGELSIIKRLNSPPLRSDPDNPTVPVIEFLHIQDVQFVVMPRCDYSDAYPFLNAREFFEFSVQVLDGISFFHRHRIAHMDIATENILLNHRGEIPLLWHSPARGQFVRPRPRAPFLSTFPIKYWFIDFNHSVSYALEWDINEPLAKPYDGKRLRPQHPPEIYGPGPFNPFAADVYQAGRVFYSYVYESMSDLPGLLELLQEMTKSDPRDRISASAASARIRQLRDGYSYDTLEHAREMTNPCRTSAYGIFGVGNHLRPGTYIEWKEPMRKTRGSDKWMRESDLSKGFRPGLVLADADIPKSGKGRKRIEHAQRLDCLTVSRDRETKGLAPMITVLRIIGL